MFENTPLYQYAERLQALKGNEDKVFQLALDSRTIKELIVFLNTEDQMGQQHVDSKGLYLFNRIAERTTYAFSAKNKRKGRAGKRYEIRDTEEYWRSFIVRIGYGVITIESDPDKPGGNIEEMFSPYLEGLTPENMEVLIKQALEFFIKWYREYLLR